MKNMQIFEPAMCCSTGICGVGVDPELLRISTVLNTLEKNGVKVKRYNLSSAPQVFVTNKVVNNYIKNMGVDGLPVSLLDGEIVITGRYPSNDEFTRLLDIPAGLISNDTNAEKLEDTGHTILLLDSTQSYNQEIERSSGDVPESAKKLLPRLRNEEETEVIIITLAEATPVYEAMRLEEDLKRAKINTNWWVINSSLYNTGTTNKMLHAKASHEISWINKVDKHSNGNFAVIDWSADEIKGKKHLEL